MTEKFFEIERGLLLPQGMRQRYLLGRFNRQKYMIDNDLLSLEYKPEEFYIQSTNFNRTLMSGYSELLGLYPEASESFTPDSLSKKMPPFKVRQSVKDQIGELQAGEALPHG